MNRTPRPVRELERCPIHARHNLACPICARVRAGRGDCPDCLGWGYIYWEGAYNDIPSGALCERCHGTGGYFPPASGKAEGKV